MNAAILRVKMGGEWVEIPAIIGKSAYQYAVESGYDGTEENFAQDLANAGAHATKVSQLVNDSGYITSGVGDGRYASKSNTYAKSEVDALISKIPKFSYEVVTGPIPPDPAEGETDSTIYLFVNEDPSSGNLYDEYIYVNGELEKIGSQKFDLTGYVKNDKVETWTFTLANGSTVTKKVVLV